MHRPQASAICYPAAQPRLIPCVPKKCTEAVTVSTPSAFTKSFYHENKFINYTRFSDSITIDNSCLFTPRKASHFFRVNPSAVYTAHSGPDVSLITLPSQAHTLCEVMAYQQPTAPTPSIQPVAVVVAGPPNTSHLDRPVASPFAGTDLRSMKTACEFSLREYMTLQKRRRQDDAAGSNERIHAQASIAVSDLRALRSEVSAIMKTAEARRWQKWLLGGIM
ncbi:hypothetical protein HD806DRAFT_249375 [Xylariaceae sp. AK1471]|nr:hypothetical protein HD806DRAFT_249375 [Xylariaceae sp. AK1471]